MPGLCHTSRSARAIHTGARPSESRGNRVDTGFGGTWQGLAVIQALKPHLKNVWHVSGDATELTQRGWPWFGDELEILIDATGKGGNTSVAGNASEWQMGFNSGKVRVRVRDKVR